MGTDLGKAYVQIIPSAEGIQGSLSSILTGAAGEAGDAGGKSIGSKLVGGLTSAVAVAGIGKAISKSISEGAELEQSIGGIETLFKESADAAKKYAADAYKTAGLSSNDYMKQVTSFSASLLQSLDGNTSAAAESANSALVDMSDNANKMGTDMVDIQNAYQGFAKQNYTMLDNLKLGYGGTKTEMERLLADAQELTGVEYDISNLNDVYAAIHAVQGELGITGTTALEAASTISGSAASMKAAWSNVLGNLALGEDIGPSLNALAETVTTFLVGNLLPAVLNIISALPGAIITFVQAFIPQITTAIMDFLPQIQTGIADGLPRLIQLGGEALTGIVTGITEALPQILDAAVQIITSLVGTLLDNLPQIVETGMSLLMSIVSGIGQALPQLLLAAANLVISLVGTLISHIPDIIEAGFAFVVGLINGVGKGGPNLINCFLQLCSTILGTVAKIDWLDLGVNIIKGIINGVLSMSGALIEALLRLMRNGLAAVKNFFGIASPSKVMRDQVGQYIPAGLAEGINGNIEPVTQAMANMTDLTTGSYQADLGLQLSSSTATARPQDSDTVVLSQVLEILQLLVNEFNELSNKQNGGDGQPINIYLGNELLDTVIADSNGRRALRAGGR